MGIFLSNGPPISHLIWRDSIWLLADSRESIQQMVTEATDAIRAGGFMWKEQSLQTMAGGDATMEDAAGIRCAVGDSIVEFAPVQRMLVLGELFDNRGSTATSIDFR